MENKFVKLVESVNKELLAEQLIIKQIEKLANIHKTNIMEATNKNLISVKAEELLNQEQFRAEVLDTLKDSDVPSYLISLAKKIESPNHQQIFGMLLYYIFTVQDKQGGMFKSLFKGKGMHELEKLGGNVRDGVDYAKKIIEDKKSKKAPSTTTSSPTPVNNTPSPSTTNTTAPSPSTTSNSAPSSAPSVPTDKILTAIDNANKKNFDLRWDEFFTKYPSVKKPTTNDKKDIIYKKVVDQVKDRIDNKLKTNPDPKQLPQIIFILNKVDMEKMIKSSFRIPSQTATPVTASVP